MCGIIGFSGHVREGQWKQTHRMLTSLFVASEHRGKDATGFVAVTSPLDAPVDQRIILEKRPDPASRFVNENGAWRRLGHQRCSTVVGHVRLATAGSPRDNRNNHPHRSADGRFYLVHNGVIVNHEATAAKHGILLRSECDSELILRFVEEAEHPALGLEDSMKHLEGSMAVVVYDVQLDLVWLATNGLRSLWLMRLARDRRWFWASTRSILLAASRKAFGEDADEKIELLFPLGEGQVHVLSPSGPLIAFD